MTEVPTLTLAFLESQPRAAAQVLEALDPSDAAAFLEEVPGRIAALTLERMAALPCSARVGLLSPEAAAGVLRQMSYQQATGILRALDHARCEAILEHLPVRLREDFRRSLRYPAGSVGAWMDHRVAALPADRTVAEALTYARQHANDVAFHLFVVGEDGELEGAVPLPALLGAETTRALASLASSNVAPLSSSATLRSAAGRVEWDEYPVMPVVGRGRKLVGSLPLRLLRRGLEAEQRPLASAGGESLLVRLAGAYLVTCAGLLAFAAGAPSATQAVDRASSHGRQRR